MKYKLPAARVTIVSMRDEAEAPSIIVHQLAAPHDLAARRAACNPCAWNVNNRCQHPAQGCAPCRQGMGLQAALAQPWFKCPMGLF